MPTTSLYHAFGIRGYVDARQACELTKWKQAALLDILAAGYAESRDFGQAVEWQEKAEQHETADEKADFLSRLELDKSDQP